jgi:CheY-like chemotaxis protein
MTAEKQYQIAVAGFATREREAIETVFQSARQQGLDCHMTHELRSAALVIADGDNATIVRLLNARPEGQKVLLIGHGDGGTGWPTLARRFHVQDMISALTRELTGAPEIAPEAGPRQFVATEPFAPLQAGQPPAPEAAPDEAVISDLFPVFVREQQGNPTAGAAQFDQPDADSEPTPLEPGSHGFGNILVVDDSEIGLRLLQRRLLQLGLNVQFARSGAEAMECLRETRFTHIFLDTMMAGMEGFKTCRAIKQLPFAAGQTPRVILVTGMGDGEDHSLGKLAGCDDYLIKPFRSADLLLAMTGTLPVETGLPG